MWHRAIRGSGGGEKYSAGDIAAGTTNVSCGFRPKFIFFADYPAYRTWRIAVYDEEVSTNQYRYSYKSSDSGLVDMGQASSVIESITNDGFTIGSNINLNEAKYWAVG